MTFDAAAPVSETTDIAAAPVAPLPAPKPITEVAAEQPATSELAAAPSAPTAAPAAPQYAPAFTPALPMPEGKRTEFLYHLASTIRDYTTMGKTPADAVTSLRLSQTALANALNPHGDLAKTASAALAQALNEQLTHENCHVPLSEPEKSMHGIFTKRQSEVQHNVLLLDDSAFVQQAQALAASGQALVAPHWFTDAKKEETIAEMVSDAPAHTLGAALGSHMLHKALAAVWKLDGPLQAPLAKAISEGMPDASPEAVIGLAKNWLHDRFHRADVIAAETKPGSGSLYIEAMKRTEATIHPAKALTATKDETPAAEAPAETLVQTAPAAEAHAPVQHDGHVQAVQPELTPAI